LRNNDLKKIFLIISSASQAPLSAGPPSSTWAALTPPLALSLCWPFRAFIHIWSGTRSLEWPPALFRHLLQALYSACPINCLQPLLRFIRIYSSSYYFPSPPALPGSSSSHWWLICFPIRFLMVYR